MDTIATKNVEQVMNGLRFILCDAYNNEFDKEERERIEQVVDDLSNVLSRHGTFGYDVSIEGFDDMNTGDRIWYRLYNHTMKSFDNRDDAISWARELCLVYPELPLMMAESFDGACVCVYERRRHKRLAIKSFLLVEGMVVQEFTGNECEHEVC